MSLIDLKKSKGSKVNKTKFTIDEFIADADNYAKGEPEIVNGDNHLNLNLKFNLKQMKDQKHVESEAYAKVERKPFRHATFTLSEDSITKLQALATDTQLAKSHIIRILIEEFCNEVQPINLHKLTGSKVD